MKSIRIAGLFVIFVAAIIMSTSCSSNKSSGESSVSNPELWKTLTETDWASYQYGVGNEMKFVGEDKAIVLFLKQDTATKAWNRAGSDVGTVFFLDENWFIVKFNTRTVAYLYKSGNGSLENSDGFIFAKTKMGAFQTKEK